MTFQQYYKGNFTSTLRWPQLDELWKRVIADPEGWYIYHTGEKPPIDSVDKNTLQQFIQKIDKLLHQEHKYDYCGIVYADNQVAPTMIKIFDPKNLGVVCGVGKSTILPRWILTRIVPEVIETEVKTKYKRWLFGTDNAKNY